MMPKIRTIAFAALLGLISYQVVTTLFIVKDSLSAVEGLYVEKQE